MDVRSDTQIQDLERTHPRNNERGTVFPNITERQMNWYGHALRRDEEHIPRKVLRMGITGREDGRKQDGKTRADDILKVTR